MAGDDVPVGVGDTMGDRARLGTGAAMIVAGERDRMGVDAGVLILSMCFDARWGR